MRELEGPLDRAAPLVLITSTDPWKLQHLVARERARRSIVVAEPQRMVRPGVWAVGVYQVKPFRRPWVRPAAVVGTGLALAAGLWWLLASLAGVLLSLGAATILGFLAVAGVVLRLARPGVTVDVHTRVRVK